MRAPVLSFWELILLNVSPFFLLNSACAVYAVLLCNLCAESLLVCLSVGLVEHLVCETISQCLCGEY